MKYLKLEYPDTTIHNVIVTNFCYNTKNNIYFIEYYDLAQSAKMYTIIEKNNNEFIRNPYKNLDIDELMNNSKLENENLLPEVIRTINNYFEKAKQNVYIEVYKKDEKYYILESICSKINIDEYHEKEKINGVLCRRVSLETINKLNKKETEKNRYYIKIIEIKNEEQNNDIKIDNKQKTEFIYYNDEKNNTIYITRNIYEKCKELGIESTFKPKIIENKNCYSIEINDLNKLMKNNLSGTEKIISKKDNKKEFIIAYKNKENNKIYIDEKYINDNKNNKKTILNKICYEVNEKYLESIYNKTIVIATIYLRKDNLSQQEIKIYNYNELKFISENIVKEYEININNRKKIKISGEIKYAISEDEINYIINKLKENNIKVNILNKRITPVNKNK